jgi:hypothetical protein
MDVIAKYEKLNENLKIDKFSSEKKKVKRHETPWVVNDSTVFPLINDTIESESVEGCDGGSQFLVSVNSEAHHRLAAR